MQLAKNSLRRFTLVLGLLTSLSLHAEQPPSPSDVPMHAMQAANVLQGDWAMTLSFSPDDGKTWQKAEPKKVNISTRSKGLLLAELTADEKPEGFNLESYLSYDQYRQVYRHAIMDDVYGLLDIYEGERIGDTLVLTNLKANTLFPMGDDVWRGFRLTIELKAPARSILIDKTDDYGKSWQPMMRLDYQQITPPAA